MPLTSLGGVVEPALAEALILAAQAKQWDMVAELAGELAARRRGALAKEPPTRPERDSKLC